MNVYLKYIYAFLENQTSITISLTIIDDYPLTTYIFNYTLYFYMNYTIKIRNIYTYNKIDLKIHTNANYLYLYHTPFNCKRTFISNIWEYGRSYFSPNFFLLYRGAVNQVFRGITCLPGSSQLAVE